MNVFVWQTFTSSFSDKTLEVFLCNGEKDLDMKTLYNAAVMNMNLGYGQQFIAIIAHWCYIV